MCSVDGCADKPKGNQAYCPKHLMRIRRHGDPNVVKLQKDNTPAQERWKKLYVVDPVTECWNWTGTTARGYGYIRDGARRNLLAHRFVWEQTGGILRPGLELDHLCRNRGCVNPLHLEQVTHTVNMERTTGHRNKTHCKRNHEFTPANTAIDKDRNGVSRRRCRACHRATVREAQRRYRARQKALAATNPPT
jgi:hypothetical protein